MYIIRATLRFSSGELASRMERPLVVPSLLFEFANPVPIVSCAAKFPVSSP